MRPHGTIEPTIWNTIGQNGRNYFQKGANKIRQSIPSPARTLLRNMRGQFLEDEQNNQPVTLATRLNFFERIRREIEAIPLTFPKTEWSNYYDSSFPRFDDQSAWTPKHINFNKVLEDIKPQTLLDIGCNQGWYSRLAAKQDIHCIAIDTDVPSIDNLYREAKSEDAAITPVIMDITNPSPGYGLGNRWLLPATERLPRDMVLALALVHHMVFKMALDFTQIVNTFSQLTKTWLLVEFVPKEDRFVSLWYSDSFQWYTLDEFVKELKSSFKIKEILPSFESPRQLILCRKLRESTPKHERGVSSYFSTI